MSGIDDVRALLRQQEITYPDLLRLLIKLEREHATTRLKIQTGLSGQAERDMKTVWAIERLANRIQIKVEKKLNE